jgi:hypothetical protein
MNKRKIIFMFGVLFVSLILAPVLLLLREEPEIPSGGPKSLTNFMLSEITGVDIEREVGLLQLRRQGNHWFLYNDPTFDVDQESALAIITNSAYLSIDALLGPLSNNLSDFGLEPPQFEITVHLDGQGSVKMFLGSQTMDKTGYYAMRHGEDSLVVVPGYAGRAVSASRQQLFNRSPGKLDWSRFERFHLQRSGEEAIVIALNPALPDSYTALERRYSMLEPLRCYISPNRIKLLFDDLAVVRFDEYIGSFDSLDEFGLGQPRASCSAADAHGSRIEINLGEPLTREGVTFYYANRERDPQNVFLISENKAAFFNTLPLTLVDRNLFPVPETEYLTKLSIRYQDSSADFSFNDTDTWDGILSSLSGMRITSLCETPTEAPPILQISATFNNLVLQADFFAYNDKLIAVDQGFGQYLSITKTSFDSFLETAGINLAAN